MLFPICQRSAPTIRRSEELLLNHVFAMCGANHTYNPALDAQNVWVCNCRKIGEGVKAML